MRILLLLSVVQITFAGDVPNPEGYDGHGLFVKLELPWTTFKLGEKLIFRYTLQNPTDKPAAVAFPFTKNGFGWPAGGQPFLEAKWQGGRHSEKPEYDIHKAVWPPKGMEGKEPQSWGELRPGQMITWNQNQLPEELFGVGCHEGLEAVQAHWLLGPNRWISSETVAVKLTNVPKSEWQEAFKINWSSYGYGKDSRSGVVYRIPIEGKFYLFLNGMYRVTEVGYGDDFKHQIDKDGTNLEITIKNAKGSRIVYFHLRHAMTRDTPWPIGPVSLFCPKPEPIPPIELESLRKTMAILPTQEAEPAGASQPATRPADKPTVKGQPSTPTSKDGPR